MTKAVGTVKNGIFRKFHDIDHFREQLHGRDAPAIQIEPGPLTIHFRSVDLGRIAINDNHVNRRVLDYSHIDPGWTYFVLNLSPAIFCGHEVNSGHLTVLNAGREYRSILVSNWRSIGIIVESSLLAEAGIWPDSDFLLDPEEASIPLPTELVGIFRRITHAVFDRSDGRIMDNISLRNALLRAIDKAITIGLGQRKAPYLRATVRGYELTQRMIRHVENRFGQRITVNEIALGLNVTPRALHHAVRSTLGMSPLDVILAFRLGHVRSELWDMRFSPASVTNAALMQDFGHLGRFSRQYSTLFGEMPSQTLRRIRALVD